MDLILELFKYLTTSFTPVEFLVVIALLGTAAFLLVNFALKRRKAIKALFGKGGEDEDMKAIKEKLDAVVTHEELERLLLVLKHEFESLRQDTNAFKEKFIEISAIRQAIVEKELNQVRSEIVENRMVFTVQFNDATEQVEKIDERLEKIDDEIKLLGRDLAVIERSLQLSLNSSSGVKLR